MGCVSSKIMTKSASYRDEWSRYSFKRRGLDGVDEIVVSKNSSEQFVALLHTANAVARRLKEGPLEDEPDANNASSLEYTNSKSNDTEESERIAKDTETVDTANDSVGPSRSFRTVEDFDAMLAASRPLELVESSVEAEEHKNIQRQGSAKESERGSRRKATAKDLAALNVSTFEFSRSGSLSEWLSQGGHACSPGSYVTPRFGGFVSQGAEEHGESAAAVFDPEMVAQFEQAMEHLTVEEDCILDKIMEDLENCNATKNVF